MNKVYNVVWSERLNTWVVCSELDKQGRQKSSKTAAPSLTGKLLVSLALAGIGMTALPAAASTCHTGLAGQTAVANGGSCTMDSYVATVNDFGIGRALADNGDTITVTSPLVSPRPATAGDPGISGSTADRSRKTGTVGQLYTSPASQAQMVGKEFVISNQQNNAVLVFDPATNSQVTVNTYNNIQKKNVADAEAAVSAPNDVYWQMNVGTATGTGSKIIVDLGAGSNNASPLAGDPTTTTYPDISAKDSRLIVAENGGQAEWKSDNRILFDSMIPYDPKITYSTYVFKPKTITFRGETITLNTVQDLIDFNTNKLVPAIRQSDFANPGETKQSAYNRIYQEAAATEVFTITEDRGTANVPADALKAVGERWVMAATGAGSTAKVLDGANLEQRVSNGAGGGVLAENGGKATVEAGASLSGHFSSLVARNQGSAENLGVISAGYFAQVTGNQAGGLTGWDSSTVAPGPNTVAAKNSFYGEGDAVTVTGNSNFINSGIINVAGFTYPNLARINNGITVGGVANDTSTAVNTAGGIINVGVNPTPNNAVNGVLVRDNGTFTNDGIIYIGRTAQYNKTDAATPIANASDEVAINIGKVVYVAGKPTIGVVNSGKVVNNGEITIGEQTQGATGLRISGGSGHHVDFSNTSVINILGNVAGQPKQNVGIQALNSGSVTDSDITHGGTINVLGANAVGENIVAEAGHSAHITNTATSRIVVDEQNTAGTRNYGIYAEGKSGSAGTPDGVATAIVDGTLALQGNEVIGAHARDNATFTVKSGSQTTFANGTNQIGYHIYGNKAVANVDVLANPVDIATDNSTLFRADEGATVNVADMTTTVSGQNAVALVGNNFKTSTGTVTPSKINVTNGTFNLNGSGSSVIRVSGGASGSLTAGKVEVNTAGTTIGIADGSSHDLTNAPVDDPTAAGATQANINQAKQTTLTSKLNTHTLAANTTGYLAEKYGTVNYTDGTLVLDGSGSTGIEASRNGTAVLNNATVNVRGDALAADGVGSTNSITINGGTVTGRDGNVFDSNGGTNTLTANNGAVLNGTMILGLGTSTVNINPNSIWNNNGDSVVTNLNNTGTVSFDAPPAPGAGNYSTITVNGDYTGGTAANPGKLVVNTYWNTGSDKDSDQLIIKGTATGNTVIATRNGIIGNITQSTAQQFSSDVVTVERAQPNAAGQQDGQPDSNAVFTGTANTTNAGQAQLVLKSTAGGKNVYAWTLYATTTPVVPPVTPPVTPPATPPGTPTPTLPSLPLFTPLYYIYAAPVAGYTLMPQVNQEIGYNSLRTLHERRGENQTLSWDDCGTCGEKTKGQTWGRLLGNHLKTDGKERFNYKTDLGGIQIGHDFAVRKNDKGGHNLTGVYLSYTHANTDFFDRYRAVNAVVSDDKYTGKGKTDAVSLGVSNTYYTINGSYLDLVGQVSWLRNKYQARDNASVSQTGWGAALSAEVGRPFALGNHAENQGGWMIEPQAQLVYQYVGLKDFNDGIRYVDQNNQHGLRGRLGARLAYNGPTANLRTKTFYGLANVWHDFLKPGSIDIGLDSVRERRNATWGEVGMGVQLPVGKNAYLYGDARYEHGFGSTKHQGYRGTLGFKYNWK